jgi:hypothetical protein
VYLLRPRNKPPLTQKRPSQPPLPSQSDPPTSHLASSSLSVYSYRYRRLLPFPDPTMTVTPSMTTCHRHSHNRPTCSSLAPSFAHVEAVQQLVVLHQLRLHIATRSPLREVKVRAFLAKGTIEILLSPNKNGFDRHVVREKATTCSHRSGQAIEPDSCAALQPLRQRCVQTNTCP